MGIYLEDTREGQEPISLVSLSLVGSYTSPGHRQAVGVGARLGKVAVCFCEPRKVVPGAIGQWKTREGGFSWRVLPPTAA